NRGSCSMLAVLLYSMYQGSCFSAHAHGNYVNEETPNHEGSYGGRLYSFSPMEASWIRRPAERQTQRRAALPFFQAQTHQRLNERVERIGVTSKEFWRSYSNLA